MIEMIKEMNEIRKQSVLKICKENSILLEDFIEKLF